uniref:NADH dehydrogenase subunit 5 n=1 Tax=Tympanophyllum maximum TaxID=3039643 RepID=UPI002551EEF8|nr:NADH dehydrogenase subunit 5 [Tympanophyllum maximum]WFP43222.1 NADH dehydrogenase subunit 5 [Tympanophyllum maximum]
MFWWVAIGSLSASLLFVGSVISLLVGFYLVKYDGVVFIEWELFDVNSSVVVMTLLFDWMSLIFMGFVLFISSLVIYYSNEYMEGEKHLIRFILLVLLFVLSMVILIVSPNIISMLLGWDGLGLVSYCLVIYYQNLSSFGAGMLTALSNRVGDVALLMVIAWMLNMGSWSYIFYIDFLSTEVWNLKLIMLIVLAAMTSSAQIPFSSWLPAAMAAPTPVSALVHSSTLVTAGVYLLIRFNNLIVVNSGVADFLVVIAMLTMFMSGVGANLEYDLSKIIALSTLSQLGLMMGILALGEASLAFFHLLTHALFKALLFMCAGSIIHSMVNCQDIRSMGGLSWFMPITTGCFNVANLALCGMPFLSGYYSSDLILEVVILSNINMLIFFLFMVSTGLTVCYSLRLAYYTMIGEFNYFAVYNIHDQSGPMVSMMISLMLMAVVGGCAMSWCFFSAPVLVCLPLFLSMLIIMLVVLGGSLGYMLSSSVVYMSSLLKFYGGVMFSGSMWFMLSLSTSGVNKLPLVLGEEVFKSVDQGWSEGIGGQGFYSWFLGGSQLLQWFQDNSLKVYLLSFMIWVLVLIFLSLVIM